MKYPQYNSKTGTHDDGPAQNLGLAVDKKYPIIRARAAVKAARARGEEVNFVLVHANDLYEFSKVDYMISGAKVISDYRNVEMGEFKLLK